MTYEQCLTSLVHRTVLNEEKIQRSKTMNNDGQFETVESIVIARQKKKIAKAIKNVSTEVIIQALKEESPGVLNCIREDNLNAVMAYLKDNGKNALELMLKDAEMEVNYIDDAEHRYFKGNTIKFELTATKQRLQTLRDKY